MKIPSFQQIDFYSLQTILLENVWIRLKKSFTMQLMLKL